MRVRFLVLIVLLVGFLLAAAGLTSAGEYSDPSGYGFRYPEGWVAVSELDRDSVAKEVREWLDNQAIDLTVLSVVVVDPGPKEFSPNCNVVLIEGEIPVTDGTLQDMLGALPGKYRSMKIEVSNLKGALQQVGANQAIVFHYDTKLPGVPFPLHQQQVYLPGGGKTHIITCTTTIDRIAQDDLAFQSILATFQVPPVQGSRLNWNEVGSSSLIGGIVGGLTAGIVVGLMQLRKRKPRPEPSDDGDDELR